MCQVSQLSIVNTTIQQARERSNWDGGGGRLGELARPTYATSLRFCWPNRFAIFARSVVVSSSVFLFSNSHSFRQTKHSLRAARTDKIGFCSFSLINDEGFVLCVCVRTTNKNTLPNRHTHTHTRSRMRERAIKEFRRYIYILPDIFQQNRLPDVLASFKNIYTNQTASM